MALQDPDFRKAFGIRLKELRKQKRWSQKELAAKVEIRFQQLNKYESGLNLPPCGDVD
ncbi:MAG TPA: helix-turn-helix transcriptional regulator [Cellvibrionaceae bacterium]